jgi:hypothetical protein
MPGLVIAVLCLVVLVALAMAYDRRQRYRGHPTTHEDERRAREVRNHNDANFGNTAGGGM